MVKRFIGVILALLCVVGCDRSIESPQEKLSGAGRALNDWALARAYPYGKILTSRYIKGFDFQHEKRHLRNKENLAQWRAIGPHNIGGRTLCLAFHPDNPDVIFAGTASGGLWKTTTAGRSFMQGDQLKLGWEQVPINFPVLAISSIAIDENNPDIIYLGTGEIYNDDQAMPAVYNRFTRGTYGIGILKSVDGGKTWAQSLDWSSKDLSGVMEILINPINSNSIWAATSEGLLVSYNGGANWSVMHEVMMAVDIEVNAADTSIIFVSHGSYKNDSYSGIYRSEDGGKEFVRLSNGLPQNYTGRGFLKSALSDPSLLYAYVSDVNTGIGLYRSHDSGEAWELMSDKDITKWQGWYAGDLAIKPDDSNTIVIAGIDVHKSSDGGKTVGHFSSWEAWNKGKVEILGKEGLDNYVHADIHKVYYHPVHPETIFFATDGGVFISEDNGNTFHGRNGGLQNTQFYSNFSNSSTDPFFAIGGLQDNASAIYDGTDEWLRVIGGDGMCTAINNFDDNIVYASSQYGNLYRSENKGKSWTNIKPPTLFKDQVSFNVPFELAPSDPFIVYLGGQNVYMSEDGGEVWRVLTDNKVDGNNTIVSIAVAPTDPSLLYLTTSPSPISRPKVFKSNGGSVWEEMKGLPDRLAMDVAIHPDNSNIVYVVFSGFNTDHVYKTTNGGVTWNAVDQGLPDVPTNTVIIDPNEPSHIYIGTDLGIYFSRDGGGSWQIYQDGLPNTIMAMHLSISPANNKLRVATHGNGVYEGNLVSSVTSTEQIAASTFGFRNYPNPVSGSTTLEWNLQREAHVNITLQNELGQSVKNMYSGKMNAGVQRIQQDLNGLSAGTYYATLESYEVTGGRYGKVVIKMIKI